MSRPISEAEHLKRVVIDYEDWTKKAKTPHPTQPEEGYYAMSWRWPPEWGEPVERFTAESPWGRPSEHLRFANGERVKRLLVAIQGYD